MRFSLALLILLLAWNTAPAAEPAATAVPGARPRVALVLSGGGARGLAHVGVIQVLEEMKIPVDCVVGTSMGALVGGTYAAGVDSGKMREVLDKTDIAALFDDLPPRSQIPQRLKRDDYRPLFDFTVGYNDGQIQLPAGASAGYKFELFLKNMIGQGASVSGLDFSKLPTPYRGVATDLETGEMRVFASGELAKVMRASMSLPAVVAPTVIEGRLYVDGGLVRNLPVDIGRQLCGDVVIAVNLGTPLLTRDRLRSVVDVASQSMHLMMEGNVRESLAELKAGDILIEPELTGYSASAFDAKADIISRGVQAARGKQQELAALSRPAAEYDAWLAERKSRELPVLEIARVRVATSVGFNAKAVERDLKFKLGKDFSVEELDRDIALIYGRADFAYLGYSVVPEEGGATLVIDAQSKPWGPGYLKFGLGALTDFTSPTQLNVAASYRRTWANSLGGEWRVDAQAGYDSFLGTEFLQPLQVRDGAFVAPYIGAQRTSVQFYQADTRLGEFRVNNVTAGIDLGLTDSIGELRLGPFAGRVRTEPEFGIITMFIPDEDATIAGVRLSGIADHLDRPRFPQAGWLAATDIRSTHVDSELFDSYTRAIIVARGVKSFDRNSFSAQVEVGETTAGDLPAYDLFQLGGPLRLSGLYLDQLSGSRYQLGSVSYYRQYSRLPSQIGRGLYVGMSVEAGRMDDPLMEDPYSWLYSGSVYWGADTILGVVYLGFGYSSLDQATAYLMIGPRF